MEYIYFNSRDELLRLRITEIAYFESDGNYCNVVTANKLRSPIGMNLTNLEHALDKQLGNEATTFIRIGKRFIVNKRYICKVNIPKQRLVITDYDRFTFQLHPTPLTSWPVPWGFWLHAGGSHGWGAGITSSIGLGLGV